MPLALLEGQGINLWEVVRHGGLVGKGVMLLLLVFSVASWGIIFQKAMAQGRRQRVTEAFRQAFRRSTNWQDLKQNTANYALTPLLGLFNSAYGEVIYQLRTQPAAGNKVQLHNMEAVERSLQRASVVEMGKLEKGLGILATIAAVSPFVGLFGTVWGIIDAFQGIGTTGSASLATVAIPISEALVATALGLVAAIPALMAYNFFQGQLKQWQTELDDFSLEFISLSERNFT
ncbi:MAG: MotA/TolQ/ExbB proton channel family protein [Firmicutes bacterium]|nr:MotA/TolQ/ExbB proton channel family protein [Bacillota bacterium]